MCSTVVGPTELHLPLVQPSEMVPIACCGQGFVPVLFMGQSGVVLDLRLVRPDICYRCSNTELQGIFPEKFLWVGGACNQMSSPSPLLGLWSDWCVWLSSSVPMVGVLAGASCMMPGL